MNLKVLYLFTGYRTPHLTKVKAGEEQGNGYWGMLRLHKFGIDAGYLELEGIMPVRVAAFLRRHIFSVYWVHVLLYPKFFSYDIIFTSTGYGTQLLHTVLRIPKPLWIMHDFSIMGLLGDETGLFQKIFAWMVSRCAGIVTLCQTEARRLQERFPHLRDRIAFIPYGVDLEYFKPMKSAQVRELFVPGRDPDRDYRTLFAAADGLGATVVVTTHASRLARFTPLPSFVQHKTFTVKELRSAYDTAAAVVIPLDTSTGLNNAMGISALYEALSMGKAIVATDTPAMRSYIQDGVNGLLVKEGDSAAMHEALARVLGDAPLRERLGEAARSYAEKHLDADRCTSVLADYFKKVAGRSRTNSES
jgi:glycosyltransferase involved in cell wall biosynthesis